MPGREFYHWQVPSFTVRVDLDFIDALTRKLSNSDVEVGGILLGLIVAPQEIEISGFEFVTSEHRRGVIYSLGAREQLSMAERTVSLSRKSGAKPVGFFRTHLRRGLFLDQDDFSLMQEVFGDPSQVALLIRPMDPGPSNAGFFVWQEGDIDRRQTALLFPFDSATLRVQGPVEAAVDRKKPQVVAAPTPSPRQSPKIPVRWIAWGAATAAGALALGAVLPKLHLRQPQPVAQSSPIVAEADLTDPNPNPPAATAPPPAVETPKPSPLPFVAPKPDEGQQVEISDLPVPRPQPQVEVHPAPRQVAAAMAPPAKVPVAEKQPDPVPEPELPVSRPSPPPPALEPVVKTAVHQPTVRVAVSMETRESSELKKVVSHVPLLGHFEQAEGGRKFSPARPYAPLEPRVPAYMATDLTGVLAVDVRLTIDKHGQITNSEVVNGGGTQFASLAASNAGSASWEPAHQGDRNVSSDVVVHYRFQPTR
jgi:hypothetical protein